MKLDARGIAQTDEENEKIKKRTEDPGFLKEEEKERII